MANELKRDNTERSKYPERHTLVGCTWHWQHLREWVESSKQEGNRCKGSGGGGGGDGSGGGGVSGFRTP